MTTIRFGILTTLVGLAISANTAQAQYIPGFVPGYGRPIVAGGATITPFSVSQRHYSVTPWLRQVTDSQVFVDSWTGVTYQRNYFSNPYGTWQTTRAFNPWVGPVADFRYANVGPIDVYARYGPYRPGFVIGR
jgi:hypothetical protein